jgi:asparagine synthase (glutamine-hydrolysing)
MVAVKPFLYGLFDQTRQLRESLAEKPGFESVTGSISSSGYSNATQNKTHIYLWSRIYNCGEIRSELKSEMKDPAGLVLELYLREGVKGFRRLNGKFTIILREPGKTTIVRDRNGEGRMIYFTPEFFTDDYRQVSDFRNFTACPDMTGLVTFLQIGYIPAPLTSLEGLQKVPAGEILYVTQDRFSFEKLYGFEEIREAERKDMPLQEAISQYGELLKDSLRRRIGDASEVGVLLSGGYDSGGNLAMLREFFPGKLRTYSIGFTNNFLSELPYARMTSEKFGAEQHEIELDGNEIEFLPDIIDYLGDPFSESGVMINYSVMKMVGDENLQVVIGGDGNDQYFGTGIRETGWHCQMRKYGLGPLSNLIDTMSDISLFDRDNLAFRIHYQNQKFLKVMEPEIFGMHNYQLKHLFPLKEIPKHPYREEIPHHFADYEELFLQRNYFLHIRHSVNEVIIFKASRLSEQFGVNLAFPYIDLNIYQFMQQLPLQLRARGSIDDLVKGKGISKYLLKELVREKLPGDVVKRPKQGGFAPLELFFKKAERRKSIYTYIRSSAFAESLRDPAWLDGFFMQYESLVSGKGYWFWYKQVKSNQLLNLLIAALWWDKVIKKQKTGNLSDYLSQAQSVTGY